MTENNQTTQNPQEIKEDTPPQVQEIQEQERQPFLDLPTRYDSWEPWVEFIATFVLALATVATAWSGFQSARWGGEQSTKFSQRLKIHSQKAMKRIRSVIDMC
jgi:hypothetical protein